jgi:hypothetical protein
VREPKQLAFSDFSLKELRVRNCNGASAMRIARSRYRIFTSVIVNHFTAELQVHELDLESLLVAGLVGVPIDPPRLQSSAAL